MTREHDLSIPSPKRKTGERELRPSNGTRKHIRRLKQEGNLKEATLIRDAAIARQNKGVKIVVDTET